MNASQVYDALKELRAGGQAAPFLAGLSTVVEAGFADSEAGNSAILAAAQLVRELNQQAQHEEALLVVNGYLGLSERIPASDKQKQFFALCAFASAQGHLGTIERIEAALLRGEPVDPHIYWYMAEQFASLGLVERARRYTGSAMEGGVEAEVLRRRPLLEALYGTDPAYRALVDAQTARQQALEAFFRREPDPQDFSQVMEAARAELGRETESFRAGRILAVAAFKAPGQREEVAGFLRGGFDALRTLARKKERLVNECAFDAVARAIARWQEPSFCELLLREFASVTGLDEESRSGNYPHYELHLVGGTIALALAALGYRGDLSLFERFLESFEWRYRGDAFVMKTRYAVWMITQDAQGAIDFLKDPENQGGLAYAACALADLDCTRAKEPIYEAARGVSERVTLNALAEACARLGRQGQPPRWEERMIHLFGEMTETELALSGGETDDQFLLRLRAQTQQ